MEKVTKSGRFIKNYADGFKMVDQKYFMPASSTSKNESSQNYISNALSKKECWSSIRDVTGTSKVEKEKET